MHRTISMKKRVLSLILIIVLTVMSGCHFPGGSGGETGSSSTPAQTSPPETEPSTPAPTCDADAAEAEQERFSAFTDDLFLETILSNTINLHYSLAEPENFGITEYPITFGEDELWDEEMLLNELTELTTELRTYDYTLLTDDQQMMYDILNHYVETETAGAPLYLYAEPLGIFTGATTQIPITLAEYSFYREQDIKDYLELLPKLKSYFELLISMEERRADAGLFMAEFTLDANIKSCEQFLENRESNYLLSSFASRLETIDWLDEQTKTAYIKQNHDIVTETVFPAFTYLADALKGMRDKCSPDGGLATLPKGKEYFTYLMNTRLGSDRTPKEMLTLIEEYQQEQFQQMFMILQRNPSVETGLNSFSFSMTDPDRILQYLKDKISEDFPEIPETSYTIHYVQKELEEVLSPAFYMIPPLDRYLENTIYINNGSLDETTLFSTLAHEGYPGHLYQNVYFHSKNTIPLRSVFSFLGYSEGWATYVECQAYAYDPEVNRNLLNVMSLNNSITLSIYAALDIYINYEGWNRQQAADYLAQFFGPLDSSITDEIYNSIAGDPCYYLAYHGGYLEIMEMRQMAEATLGSKFNLKEFHQFVLDLGDCPFSLANQRLMEWLK